MCLQQMQSKERASLMDTYEYVMFGRIFKYEDTPSGANNQVQIAAQAPSTHSYYYNAGPELSWTCTIVESSNVL